MSSLNLYKHLIHFRNHSAILKNGDYTSIDIKEDIFGYERTIGDKKLLILLNFSGTSQHIDKKSLKGVVQLSTYLDRYGTVVDEHIALRPHEGLILKVSND